MTGTARSCAAAFCAWFGLAVPILEASMAGASPPARAVAGAGGMAGFGALLSPPGAIARWFADFRARGGGAALARWGPPPADGAADARPPDFDVQWQAIIGTRPAAVSTIMGLPRPALIDAAKAAGIAWFATVTTLAGAEAAVAAGADAVIAQGSEAGGHRRAFDPAAAETGAAGLFALLPILADRIPVPIVAAGGIADGHGIAAALALGASAAQIGTALLVADAADTPAAWRGAIAARPPDATRLTRAYTGRHARAVANAFVCAEIDAAPYPVQRGLTAALRADATARGDIATMQARAGQAAMMARPAPVVALVAGWWADARALLPQG